MAQFGLLQRSDLIEDGVKLATIPEDRLYDAFNAQLLAHQGLVAELTSLLTFNVPKPQVRYGFGGSMDLLPADEYARADMQKIGAGYSLGFPIQRYQIAIGWTRDYFKRKTTREFQAEIDAMFDADVRMRTNAIKARLFDPTNSVFADPEIGDLPVKALINADGSYTPPFNDVPFDGSTHTHFLVSGNVSPTQANVQTMKDHLTEHGHTGNLVLYLNPAQEAAARGWTGFVAKQQIGIVNPLGTYSIVRDETNGIGRVIEVEVRLRTWVPAGYMFMFNEYGANSNLNPIGRRLSEFSEDNNLHIVAREDRFPLHGEWAEVFFGVGAYNRTNGVIMQIKASGNYDIPTFA